MGTLCSAVPLPKCVESLATAAMRAYWTLRCSSATSAVYLCNGCLIFFNKEFHALYFTLLTQSD